MLLSYITFVLHRTKYTKRRAVSYSFLMSCVSPCVIKYDTIEYFIIISLFDISYTNLFRRLTFPNLVFLAIRVVFTYFFNLQNIEYHIYSKVLLSIWQFQTSELHTYVCISFEIRKERLCRRHRRRCKNTGT